MYGFSFPDVLIPCHSNKLLRLKSELRGEDESASTPLTAKKNFTNALFPPSYQQISTSSIPIQLAPALSQEWRCIVFLGAAWENVTKHKESSRKSALTSVTVKHSASAARAKTHTALQIGWIWTQPQQHAALLKSFRSGCLCSLIMSAGLYVIRRFCLFMKMCCLILMFCMVCSLTAVHSCSVQIALFKKNEEESIFIAHVKAKLYLVIPSCSFWARVSGGQIHSQNHTHRKLSEFLEELCWVWLSEVSLSCYLQRGTSCSPVFCNKQMSKNLPHRYIRFSCFVMLACKTSRCGLE